MRAHLLIPVFCISLSCHAAPVNVNEYLARYGYLGERADHMEGGERMVDAAGAIAEFQAMNGLSPTGKLDGSTLRLMQTPRCAMPDKTNGRTRKSLRSKWSKTSLSYFINSYPPLLDVPTVDSVVWRSFLQWQNVSALEFRRATSVEAADIVIEFQTVSSHSSCSGQFASNDLAHAFYPETGRVHFNLEWRWDGAERLGPVAVHEFGHAIGLMHNNDIKSVMYAYNTPDAKHITSKEVYELRQAYGSKKGGRTEQRDENSIDEAYRRREEQRRERERELREREQREQERRRQLERARLERERKEREQLAWIAEERRKVLERQRELRLNEERKGTGEKEREREKESERGEEEERLEKEIMREIIREDARILAELERFGVEIANAHRNHHHYHPRIRSDNIKAEAASHASFRSTSVLIAIILGSLLMSTYS